MQKIKKFKYTTGDSNQVHTRLLYKCPGCKFEHSVDPSIHSFNGDLNKPTFSPSLLLRYKNNDGSDYCCHSFMNNGMIQFLGDCTHELANGTVEVKSYTDEELAD